MNTSASEMTFQPKTPILIDLPDSKSSCKGTIVGVKEQHYVTIDLPFLNDMGELTSGTTYVGQLISDGVLMQISFKVICILMVPNLVVFASWPELLSIKPLRKSNRVPCNFPVIATFLNTMQSCDAVVSDISIGGCMLQASLSLREQFTRNRNSHVALTFNLASIHSIDSISGKILSVDTVNDNLAVRLQFGNLKESTHLALAKFVEWVANLKTM